MPTYAYRCAACGHAFDIHQSFSDEALTVCPECEGPLRKQYGSVGVTFKGSGFYRTDSRGSTSTPSTTTPSKPSTPAKSTAPKTASA
ncbi:regulatory protein, FmdB family [Xylanimonas cellulosilytica DSM 15894]|uniref:Regulatory protein, FmdB family n=1 Tax=Xylanimonas cellulosilytica (strain DSM 15894 / JCM 12276 / CECT 5975 / KCTC 9989 / LMG 20990 / NBRC 107835 / XIL07) TaxID=446471 RepID=D1BYF7_XYLCX|nr:FmdB family zinc ribbon protein [Xylanimonas cellulosilytica]ACZ31829.1 regulatory protein, FmdB family [Xylanimonas cellulosilytica DSM 15894]